MTYNKFILPLLILFSYQFSVGQEKIEYQFNSNDLIGTWYPKYNPVTHQMNFKKNSVINREYGQSIKILENGKIVSHYSAPCGNDRGFLTKNYFGDWNLNKNVLTITISKPVSRKGIILKKRVQMDSGEMIITQMTIN